MAKLYETTTPETGRQAAVKFDADLRGTSTPEAMAALFVHIHRKDFLKHESAELLLDGLLRNQEGDSMLKGMLPLGTTVAHKPGGFGGTTNDAGIITLPDAAGHVTIAVFIKSSDKNEVERERAIAQIARAVYDLFLFQDPAAYKETRK